MDQTITLRIKFLALHIELQSCLIITTSMWDLFLKNPVDVKETCPGQKGNITQYQISFQTGSLVNTENVNNTRCTAGQCSHTFQPPSNPPSSYDSVSVAAESVVGVGAARLCTAQPISESNDD